MWEDSIPAIAARASRTHILSGTFKLVYLRTSLCELLTERAHVLLRHWDEREGCAKTLHVRGQRQAERCRSKLTTF